MSFVGYLPGTCWHQARVRGKQQKNPENKSDIGNFPTEKAKDSLVK